jgi:ectoine hydroxylase-related dioxygenase (phytanoyl-CoA dioxygenase family)
MKQSAGNQLDSLGADINLLSAQQRLDLDKNGYILIEDLIDPLWVESLKIRFDEIKEEEGELAAREHHKEVGAPRLANLVNKGTVWEKVWSHPFVLSACRYLMGDEFKISSLNGREAILGGGLQPVHGDWKRPRTDFPKVHVVNSLWVLDNVSPANGGPRIIPGTNNRPEFPEDVLDDILAPHPNEIILTAKAGSVLIFNAHTWHGGTNNRNGERRRILHGYYTAREDPQQQDQLKWLTKATASRLTPSQKWLLDVDR